MLELASTGSKVLQWRSVALAAKYQIPLRVLSSFKPGAGTLIDYSTETLESPQLSGLSHQMQLRCCVLTFAEFQENALAALAKFLAEHQIQLDYITQVKLDKGLQVHVIISREDFDEALPLVEKFAGEKNATLTQQDSLARISLVGLGLHAHAWIVSAFLEVLAKEHIAIEHLIYSECVISAIIAEADLTKAARKLHEAFFE